MSDSIAKHAIVIGAGMAGLVAAKALSPYFDHVTILERDKLPSDAGPRQGTPQARHLHALLTGGLKALNELLPGIEVELESAGAVRMTTSGVRLERPGFDPYPQRELGLSWLSLSRPLLELVTRQAVERQKNIQLLDACRVTEIVARPGRPVIEGVRYDTSDHQSMHLSADFIVDASGRGSHTLALLDSTGAPKPDETEIGIDMAYSTAVFKRPVSPPSDWQTIMVLPFAPKDNRGAILSPIENDQWILSLGANHGDAPPGDFEGIVEFAKSLRTLTIYEAIKELKPIGPIMRYLLPHSVRRHFETSKYFPKGLLPIGDAICRFNPVFGQGMTVAAQEAIILRRLLDARAKRADPLDRLASAFFEEIQGVLETPWGVAMSDFVYPKTRGKRPENFEQAMQFNLGLVRLGAQDASVHKLMFEVNHLLKGRSALRAPDIMERVNKLMATPT